MIRPLLLVAFIASFGSVLPSASASTVEYSALGNYLLTTAYNATASTNATRLPTGLSVELGTFPAGFNFSLNRTSYTGTNAGFTLFNTTTVGNNTGNPAVVGEFDKTTGNLDSLAAGGSQLYIWVFDNAVPASSTAWAIVTNPTWVTPQTGATFLSIDTSDTGTIIAAGALGAIVTDTTAPLTGTNFSIRLSAVPEPSTYVLSTIGGIGMFLLAKRRRKLVATC